MSSKPSELLKTLQQLTEGGKLSADTLLPMIMATLIDVRMQMDELTAQQATQENLPAQLLALTSEVAGLKLWKAESEKERARLIGILIGATVAGGATGGGVVAIILKALGG
jgi:hypothetical protein